MADSKVSALDTLGSVDRTADYLYVVDATGPTSYKMTVNGALGFSGGNPVSTSDTQSLTNKTLDNTNTVTLRDDRFTLQDNADTTKQAVFQLSGITTGTTRTYTLPDASTTLVGTDATQTLTNKTLTSPTINTATISNPTLTVDTISEFTGAAGVTIDGLLIKDGLLPAGNIQPLNLTSGTGSGWDWEAWTPTWTNLTVGNGTVDAKYKQIGKTVSFYLKLTFGSTTAVTGAVIFTLPVTATAFYDSTSVGPAVGMVRLIDTGTAQYEGRALFATTAARIRVNNASATYVTLTELSSTVPFTWTTSDVLYVVATYEAD